MTMNSSDDKNNEVENLVKAGTVMILGAAVQCAEEKIAIESAWIITNIAATTNPANVKELYKAGIVDILISLVSKSGNPLKEQVLWALGNIAVDSIDSRNYLISSKVVEGITDLFKPGPMSAGVLRLATWTMSKLCKGRPSPAFERVNF